MRDLIISLVLFALMIGVIAYNSLFVIESVEELLGAVEAVPDLTADDCELKIKELKLHWRDFKRIARLTLDYVELNRMECLIEEMECHRLTGNVNDFEHAKVMMINLLREIARLEKISLNGVM